MAGGEAARREDVPERLHWGAGPPNELGGDQVGELLSTDGNEEERRQGRGPGHLQVEPTDGACETVGDEQAHAHAYERQHDETGERRKAHLTAERDHLVLPARSA